MKPKKIKELIITSIVAIILFIGAFKFKYGSGDSNIFSVIFLVLFLVFSYGIYSGILGYKLGLRRWIGIILAEIGTRSFIEHKYSYFDFSYYAPIIAISIAGLLMWFLKPERTKK